ncbi:uncharacterized protein LOC133918766 [Phragmites australis]|uniref:uncharacterized protein LOC133918766 n=1 Tax=Phragmites australis TaxID=29695 RepID=UPI002D769E1B|nr:uncharacterized protein LOC133918766 [Phragmites australis]
MYSGAGNVMLLAETEDMISDLKQGELSLIDYIAELKRLWADVDHYDPIELPHANCVAWVKKWLEKRRFLQFLRGLNSEFEGRRATIFHQTTLLSLEEAIAAMAQEELRLKVMRGTTSPPSRPVFAATRTIEARKYFNCGDTGHLIRDYPKSFRPNRGRGRGSSKGALRGGGGRGGKGGYRANVVGIEEEHFKAGETSSVLPEESKQLRGKGGSSGDQDQEVHSGDFINFAYVNEGETNREASWECNQA